MCEVQAHYVDEGDCQGAMIQTSYANGCQLEVVYWGQGRVEYIKDAPYSEVNQVAGTWHFPWQCQSPDARYDPEKDRKIREAAQEASA